jgi:hypothetical protein
VTIEVDVNNLWKVPPPFKVYTAEGMEGDGEERTGEYFRGFVIKMQVDPRDLQTFRFSACVLNASTVCVTAPMLDFHDAGGDAEEEELAQTNKPDPREDNYVLWESLTNGRLEFKKKKIENKVYFHLVFPSSTFLSADVLLVNRNSRDGALLLEALNLSVDIPYLAPGGPVPVTDAHGAFMLDERGRGFVYAYKFFAGCLIWRVADTSKATRKQFVGRADEAQTEGFEAMFGNLNVG